MMPSDPASVRPCRIALIDCELAALIAGYAKPPAFARSSISAYCSGVATGMTAPCSGDVHGNSSEAPGRLGMPRPARSASSAAEPATRVGWVLVGGASGVRAFVLPRMKDSPFLHARGAEIFEAA